MQPAFGRVITSESYFNGKLKSTKVEYSIPTLVKEKSEVLSELLKCLDLITTKQTHHLTITVEADPATHNVKMITRSYVTK